MQIMLRYIPTEFLNLFNYISRPQPYRMTITVNTPIISLALTIVAYNSEIFLRINQLQYDVNPLYYKNYFILQLSKTTLLFIILIPLLLHL